ncbi:ribosomal RNA processing protein 36 homolog [Salarias fasciatus]|uniref:rRNA biogenesis protein RRP36 n=1 Tax=Salarias fasciatus TaxID=181472 RepID=A0A672FEB2_SALFA|nr:ribosomal RNA processing protein 36 homolog [Salarias fasciatus]XP_029949833.1 ribosomal RNA processing protein 36 homolog [Salarias fasciatus]
MKERQRQDLMEEDSSDGEDSDVERNFTLLTERGGGGGGGGGGGLEEGIADCGEEEEENSDGAEEEDESSEASEEEEDEEEEEAAAGSSDIHTEEDMKRELSNMSFEDIMKLQNKVGTKVYSQVSSGRSSQTDGSRAGKKKRLNKNRPTEVSSKRPAPFLRQVVSVRKPMLRDPRFDDLSGEYKAEIFNQTYKFIENIKSREKKMIQKQLRRTKKQQQREKLQFLLQRMENQEREQRRREQQRERELQLKRQQRERASQGAAPFFLSKAERKKLQLAEKYQELKRSGKLDNFLSKKRRRNAVKDRRKLPRNAAGAGARAAPAQQGAQRNDT